MAASPLPTPPFSQQVLEGSYLSRAWQNWVQSVQNRLGGTFDKIDAAYQAANAAAPASAEVVASAGLAGGGQIGGNTAVALYSVQCAVAALPTAAGQGDWAYAIDGRKAGEAAGAGTGVPCWWSNSAWYAVDSGAVVAA